MKSKYLLLSVVLNFSCLFANAAPVPAVSKIDWSKNSSQPYALAFDVESVQVLTAPKGGYSVTVSKVVSVGSLDNTRLLLRVVNILDNEEASFVIDSRLISVNGATLKWATAATSSTPGLYLTVKGMLPTAKSSRDLASRRTLEIKLTDATGYLFAEPKLKLY